MRNIMAYPVTDDEILKFLDDLSEGFDKELVGDIRPTLVAAIRQRIEEHPYEVEDIEVNMRKKSRHG